MSAYELRTFADIYNAVLEEVKVQSSDTTQLNRIKRDINMVYLDEVVPHIPWYWLRKKFSVTHKCYYNTGTVTVTESSNTVTLSATPSVDLTGHLFKVNDYDEIYKIRSHSTTTLTLESPYTSNSGSGKAFKIWHDGLVLPVDIEETYKVWNDHKSQAMEPLNDKEFLELVLNNPELEGRPDYYRVTDYTDPNPFATISGLPALSTRASSDNIKTLVFASDVSSYLEEGDYIQISSAGNESYNGEFIIENVATTTVAYIATVELDESPTADASLVLKLRDSADANEVYRKLELYPYLDDDDTTIHIEGVKRVPALENDSDEPLIPLRDRIVLVYGALQKAWSRLRNPEEASRNFQLFERKLIRMAAKIQDSTDFAQLKVSKLYLKGKRMPRNRYNWFNF